MPWSRSPSLLLLTALVACDPDTGDTSDLDTADTGDKTDTDDTSTEPFALVGEWAEFGGTFPDETVWGYHTITEATWTDAFGSVFSIVDHDAGAVIAQNGDGNPYNPSLWSRFDVVTVNDVVYYCQTAYAAASEDDARATPASDAGDLDAGCGGFPWSRLVAKLPVTGSWNDGFADHVVDEKNWAMGTDAFDVWTADPDARFLVALNQADNAWNAGKWSRFDWHVDGSDLYYCQSAYDADTAEAAAQAEADHADLDAGCGGFSWSLLAPVAE